MADPEPEDWTATERLTPADRLQAEALIVDVTGFEGPLDLLLTLSRTQKVDLRRISVLQLAEQYLGFVTKARDLRIELAADYLVMAAWLAFLKSRLLLQPEPGEAGPSAEDLAAHLAWSISQMGGIKPIKEQIRLLELLESQIQVLSPASTKKSIQIINAVSGDATLLADKNHLAVIVRNLLQNAIKFTHSGGSISIKAIRQQDKLMVEISDTGIGMSKERLANLFRLSTSSSKLGTDLEQGTGLGLVLVKELVEANEGSIEVNTEPNQGTLFKLYFRTSPVAELS